MDSSDESLQTRFEALFRRILVIQKRQRIGTEVVSVQVSAITAHGGQILSELQDGLQLLQLNLLRHLE